MKRIPIDLFGEHSVRNLRQIEGEGESEQEPLDVGDLLNRHQSRYIIGITKCEMEAHH